MRCGAADAADAADAAVAAGAAVAATPPPAIFNLFMIWSAADICWTMSANIWGMSLTVRSCVLEAARRVETEVYWSERTL